MQNDAADPADTLAELRKRAQAKLKKQIEGLEPLSPEKTRELVHELRTYQIELELQNEELRQAQVRLQKMQYKYSGLYDFAPVGYLTISGKGLIIEANLTAALLLGVERTNLIRQPFSAFVAPENQDAYYHSRKKLLQAQESPACELKLVKKDGSQFHALLKFSINTDIDGTTGRYRIVISDITDRVQAEEALSGSKKMLEGIINAMPVRVFWKDMNLVFLGCNTAFARDAGFAGPEDIIGKDDYQMVWREQAELYRNDDLQVLRSGEPRLLIEEPQTTHDGKTITLLTSKIPLRNAHGQIIGVIGTYIDISDRKQAEKELNDATKRWRNTFDSVPDIITIQDKNMVIVQANKATYDLFAASGKNIVGEKCYSLFKGHPEPCKGCPELSTLKTHQDYHEIIKHADLDRIFMMSSAPILDENKNTEYIVHIARDITKQKKLEEQLNQAYKMDAIGTLAGGIAHDFNNILTIIVGFGELIRDNPSDESFVRQQIDQVLKAADRSKFLVQQILAFSRQADYELIAMKLQSLVKETVKLLKATLPATVKIVEDINPQCGIVNADPTQINQIVMNLCTNAVQAMDEKGLLTITLQNADLDAETLKSQPEMTPGPFVRLSVADTGSGIDEETLKSMYVPFFTTKAEGKGTGMGLSVVHGIAESHGGFIVVDTEPGRGSTFSVFFPVIQGEKFFEVETESQPRHGKERILFVDDEEALTKLSRRTLESLGYVVTAETDSMKALEIFKADPDQFDLVISDQSMPEMSGLEMADEILQIKPGLPIIICTGYSSKIPGDDTKVQGISKFLSKPYNKKILSEAIKEVLDREL